MIIFVGDKPGKKNIDPDVAFVGTKSYARLLQWIGKLDISVTDIVLCNKNQVFEYRFGCSYFINTNSFHCDIDSEDVIIALGNEASKSLTAKNLRHFKLPHPSGRNRLLNDAKKLDKELKKCYGWIHS